MAAMTMGMVAGGGFRGPRCRRSAGHDQVDAVAHQLRDELAETLPLAVGRAVLDVEVLPLHVSELTQPVEQRRKVLFLVLCPVERFSRMPMAKREKLAPPSRPSPPHRRAA